MENKKDQQTKFKELLEAANPLVDYLYKNYDKPVKFNILTLANDILFISPSTIWKDIYTLKNIKNPWKKI